MVKQVRLVPSYRKAIAWKRLFSTLVLTAEMVRRELDRIRKDGVA
jgi:hypothetical protein